MKIGDRVKTPDGDGVIVDTDQPHSNRWGVKLDIKKYDYCPAYYFSFDLTKIEKNI